MSHQENKLVDVEIITKVVSNESDKFESDKIVIAPLK